MFHLNLVAVYLFAAEFTVDFMKTQTVGSAQQGGDFLNILTNFINVAGASWIVSRGLNTAGEYSIGSFKTNYVVGLPAVQRYGRIL